MREWERKNQGLIDASAKRKEGIKRDGVMILPQQFYSEEYTFFGHSPGGTWHGKDVAVALWFVERPWIFVLVPTFVFVGFFGVLRRRRVWRRVGLTSRSAIRRVREDD